MRTKGYFETALQDLRGGLEKTIKQHIEMFVDMDGTDEVMFHEYDISSPIHIPNEDGNLASTISGVKLGGENQLIFDIDSGLSDHEVLIEEISTENLIYILEELEFINNE